MRALLLCVAVACGGQQIQERKAADLSGLGPATLEAKSPKEGDPREAKVRIWVDQDFRTQNVRWRAQIEEQIDEANQFLAPALGVRLEIDELKPWEVRQADRTGPAGGH